jgi:hypothetical protein
MSQALFLPPAGFGSVLTSSGSGKEAETVWNHFIEAMSHYWELPASRQSLDSVHKFCELAKEWKASCGPTSSVTQLAMNPAYQRIIGMGTEAVPLILQELERSPDHWFWALNAITGADPVESADKGSINRMAKAWIRWGKEQGYTW